MRCALKPFVQKIEGDGLAEPDLQHFMQPSLQDPEAKQDAYDNEKHPDLVDENGEVLLADCVVNAALPIVQLDLEHGIERDHKRNCRAELHERAFRVGVEDYAAKVP